MMNRKLRINPSDAQPIWQQIEAGVRELIAAGVLAPGTLVASVRELAQELRVNPAIVAKAYQRLADAGVLSIRSWEGTYVATPPLPMAATERRELLREEALRYATVVAATGASSAQAVSELALALRTVFLRRGALRIVTKMTRFGRRKMGGLR